MEYTFNDYLKRVKEQLKCNASEDYKNNNVTYMYTNEQVDNHIEYFKKCKKKQLSEYKSLLFFGDYMEGDYDI